MFNRKDKVHKTLDEAQKAAEQAAEALESADEKMKDDEMDEMTGGANPFSDAARVSLKNFTDDVRGRI